MYLLGINGSMRKKANTNMLIEIAFASAKEVTPTLETKVFHVADFKIDPCHSCFDVCSKVPYVCTNKKDDFQFIFDEIKKADGVIIGSPVYYIIPSRLTAIIERFSCLVYFNEVRGYNGPEPFEGKPCGLIAVCALDSPLPVLEHLNKFAVILRMKPVPIKAFPFMGVAGRVDFEKDTTYHPIDNAKALGKLLASEIQSK